MAPIRSPLLGLCTYAVLVSGFHPPPHTQGEKQQQQQQERHDGRGHRRLTLESLNTMWQSGLQQDDSMQGGGFEATLEAQWSQVQQSQNRVAIVACVETAGDAVQRVRDFLVGRRSKVFYSTTGGDTCLVAHAAAEEVQGLAALPGVLSVDPLPPSAKSSSALHTFIKQQEAAVAVAQEQSGLSGTAGAAGDQPAHQQPQGGDSSGGAVPTALDVTLVPGAAGKGFIRQWQADLKHHGRGLWSHHLSAVGDWELRGERELWRAVAESHPSDACNFDAMWGEDQDGDSSVDRVVVRGVDALTRGGGGSDASSKRCLLSLVAYLSTRDDVLYVDELPAVYTQNTVASWIMQSDVESGYPMWTAGLQGATEIVAVADSGVDTASCFFSEADAADNVECSSYSNPIADLTKRKVVQYVGYVDCTDEFAGHGTHVAGSVAGAQAGTSAGQHLGDGIAFQAKLAVFDFGDGQGNLYTPANLATQMLEPAYDIGARVSSNSWGAIRNAYTTLDAQMDAWAYAHPDSVLIVAAGNCGDAQSNCEGDAGPINGAGSVLSPGLAKNVITVGASESTLSSAPLGGNVNNVAYFSSQGPLPGDGRWKPDVVAPGYHTFSAEANPDTPYSCKVAAKAGTSMATPVVASAAAMIRQYFLQGWYPDGKPNPSRIHNPSAALVKALLVNSGLPMSQYRGLSTTQALTDGPDGYQGWGRVRLDGVLNIGGSVDLHAVDMIYMAATGAEDLYSFEVSEGYEGDFRATLVYMEPAGAVAATQPVYNDLDLSVVSDNGVTQATHYPNGGTGADAVNTVERVVVPNAENYKTFNVTVAATSVVTTDKPFYALVVTGGRVAGYAPGLADYSQSKLYVSATFTVTGSTPQEAATANYATAFASALAPGLAGDAAAADMSLVRVGLVDDAAAAKGARVTVHIAAASMDKGTGVMAYLLNVSEAADGADAALLARLKAALAGVTSDGCVCASAAAGYDCSHCATGAAYGVVTAVTLAAGDYNLQTGDTAGTPMTHALKISIPIINHILRTSNYYYIVGIIGVVALVSGALGLAILFTGRKHDQQLQLQRSRGGKGGRRSPNKRASAGQQPQRQRGARRSAEGADQQRLGKGGYDEVADTSQSPQRRHPSPAGTATPSPQRPDGGAPDVELALSSRGGTSMATNSSGSSNTRQPAGA